MLVTNHHFIRKYLLIYNEAHVDILIINYCFIKILLLMHTLIFSLLITALLKYYYILATLKFRISILTHICFFKCILREILNKQISSRTAVLNATVVSFDLMHYI